MGASRFDLCRVKSQGVTFKSEAVIQLLLGLHVALQVSSVHSLELLVVAILLLMGLLEVSVLKGHVTTDLVMSPLFRRSRIWTGIGTLVLPRLWYRAKVWTRLLYFLHKVVVATSSSVLASITKDAVFIQSLYVVTERWPTIFVVNYVRDVLVGGNIEREVFLLVLLELHVLVLKHSNVLTN